MPTIAIAIFLLFQNCIYFSSYMLYVLTFDTSTALVIILEDMSATKGTPFSVSGMNGNSTPVIKNNFVIYLNSKINFNYFIPSTVSFAQ